MPLLTVISKFGLGRKC